MVDNFSAHFINRDIFESIFNDFLPLNMESVIQPVDAAVGRSFKATFGIVLVEHLLNYIKTLEKSKQVFNINQAIIIYDSVRLVAKEWDLFPKSVVFYSCLKTELLASF